ncbi:GIY-YIG nuclease family protein [Haloflavibacter putidus]|uniref:GIY-YIG nuclease family protein n=1 Tax=Haloflavibacter putidus TaxID=2576776 RepID=A0A507ZPU5_9FLAO|nr:GIY-YIG nuclease family protein [Haloflavibacter putidus]TQD38523.1 GIY-YIG nuclease family protein [Haloflavibacter putidus]
MSKDKLSIEDIFEDDDLGILKDTSKQSNVKSTDQRLIESFEEINVFVDEKEREPEQGNGISEMRLYLRLKGFRENDKKKFALKDVDRHNLLFEPKKVESVADILEDDDFGLLADDEGDASIFDFKHTPKEKKEADFVAQRKAMSESEFEKYDKQFKRVHQEIKLGLRSLKPFKNAEKNLKEGKYYILDGVLLYLEVGDISEAVRELGDRVRKDVRTRTVFDNGTYSNMLYRSLAKQLYNNGKVVTDLEKDSEKELFSNVEQLEDDDKETGWIYVLKSKSTHSEISKLKNLYKIGFSTVPVQKRVLNARNEATYLNAEVEVVATFKCINVNTQKFENLIHRFFSQAQLQIDIYDKNKNRITPREWFVVPYPIIERAIGLFNTGEIINYHYDFQKERIIKNS